LLFSLLTYIEFDFVFNSGMEFIHANTKKLLGETKNHCPRWFAIIFPGMVELAHTVGVELVFSNRLHGVVSQLFYKRQQILEK
jgi:geranyllinalool synthase